MQSSVEFAVVEMQRCLGLPVLWLSAWRLHLTTLQCTARCIVLPIRTCIHLMPAVTLCPFAAVRQQHFTSWYATCITIHKSVQSLDCIGNISLEPTQSLACSARCLDSLLHLQSCCSLVEHLRLAQSTSSLGALHDLNWLLELFQQMSIAGNCLCKMFPSE